MIRLTSLLRRRRKLVIPAQSLLIGWQEWCALPRLGLPAVKAKIDTGARTSAIHAFDIATFRRGGELFVRFFIHPLQKNNEVEHVCTARVVDERSVMSSNGHKEHRYVIRTPICLGDQSWEIDITLSNRDPLTFRMLLGRNALKRRVIIDPSRSLCQGNIEAAQLLKLYGA